MDYKSQLPAMSSTGFYHNVGSNEPMGYVCICLFGACFGWGWWRR